MNLLRMMFPRMELIQCLDVVNVHRAAHEIHVNERGAGTGPQPEEPSPEAKSGDHVRRGKAESAVRAISAGRHAPGGLALRVIGGRNVRSPTADRRSLLHFRHF
jgi:hypothetical protein